MSRITIAVVVPAGITAALPLARSVPLCVLSGSMAVLALTIVALAGALAWLAARAISEHRMINLALLAASAVALLSPAGGSLLAPAALALAHVLQPRRDFAANDNLPATDRRFAWVPISPERARLLLAQSAP